jgi:rubrerythrin
MEQDGKKFYEEAAQKAKSEGTAEIFRFLAKGEVYHILRIQEIYDALEKNPTWTEAMCEFSPPVEDPKIFSAALAKGNMGTGDLDDLKALELGITMEARSIEFYQRLAKQATDPKERRFLLSLINEGALQLPHGLPQLPGGSGGLVLRQGNGPRGRRLTAGIPWKSLSSVQEPACPASGGVRRRWGSRPADISSSWTSAPERSGRCCAMT